MKLNDVQKRLLSQKQVTKPYMMKGGKLPKAQMGDPSMRTNEPMFRYNPYEKMDSTQLANVFNDLYGGYKFMNTGLGPNNLDKIRQMFIESQGRMDPTIKFPMYRGPSGRMSFKKGGTTKGSGSNGVL